MRAKLITLTLTALAVTACDKTTDPESGALSASEAKAIALALDDAGLAATRSQESNASANLIPTRPALDVFEHSGNFSFTGGCDLAGSATLTGSGSFKLDSDLGTVDFDLTATGTFVGCAFESEDDVEISLDGAVDFAAARHLEEGLATGSQSYHGSLDYTTDEGKEGVCAIDVDAEFSLSHNAASRVVMGNVCGQSVNATTSWTRTE